MGKLDDGAIFVATWLLLLAVSIYLPQWQEKQKKAIARLELEL